MIRFRDSSRHAIGEQNDERLIDALRFNNAATLSRDDPAMCLTSNKESRSCFFGILFSDLVIH